MSNRRHMVPIFFSFVSLVSKKNWVLWAPKARSWIKPSCNASPTHGPCHLARDHSMMTIIYAPTYTCFYKAQYEGLVSFYYINMYAFGPRSSCLLINVHSNIHIIKPILGNDTIWFTFIRDKADNILNRSPRYNRVESWKGLISRVGCHSLRLAMSGSRSLDAAITMPNTISTLRTTSQGQRVGRLEPKFH
ncbi:hypothetical protein AMTRI_Chr11g152250 [Amborella trichopoda]